MIEKITAIIILKMFEYYCNNNKIIEEEDIYKTIKVNIIYNKIVLLKKIGFNIVEILKILNG